MSEKKAAKKSAKVVDIKELTERLGPVKKVVKTSKAEGTESAVVLHLECGHKRIGTKRASLRCGKCRKGARPVASTKKPVKAVAKKTDAKKTEKTVINVQKSGKPKITREPVTDAPVEKVVEMAASAMSHKRAHKK